MQLYSHDALLPEPVNDWETDFWLELCAYYRNQSSQYCAEEPRDQHALHSYKCQKTILIPPYMARPKTFFVPNISPSLPPGTLGRPSHKMSLISILELVTLSHLRALVHRKETFFLMMTPLYY